MGPPQRERFNSRARSSTAGGSSHKKRARGPKPSRSGVEAIEDAPQELDIVVPKTLEEKEQDRAARIKEQVRPCSHKSSLLRLEAHGVGHRLFGSDDRRLDLEDVQQEEETFGWLHREALELLSRAIDTTG